MVELEKRQLQWLFRCDYASVQQVMSIGPFVCPTVGPFVGRSDGPVIFERQKLRFLGVERLMIDLCPLIYPVICQTVFKEDQRLIINF